MSDFTLDASGGFAFGRTSYPRGGRYGPLAQPYLILLLIEKGAAEIVVDNESQFLISAGECGVFYNHDSALMLYQANVATDVSWLECRLTTFSERLFEYVRDLKLVENGND